MPYLAVGESHCLFVDPSLDPSSKFEAQCDKIISWRSNGLTAHELLGLMDGCSKEEFDKAKKLLLKHFHPDKNRSSAGATEACQILVAACEFIQFQQEPDKIRNNPFDAAYKRFLKQQKVEMHTFFRSAEKVYIPEPLVNIMENYLSKSLY